MLQLRESQKKEDTHARNVRKAAKRCVLPMICGPAGSKSRLVGDMKWIGGWYRCK